MEVQTRWSEWEDYGCHQCLRYTVGSLCDVTKSCCLSSRKKCNPWRLNATDTCAMGNLHLSSSRTCTVLSPRADKTHCSHVLNGMAGLTNGLDSGLGGGGSGSDHWIRATRGLWLVAFTLSSSELCDLTRLLPVITAVAVVFLTPGLFYVHILANWRLMCCSYCKKCKFLALDLSHLSCRSTPTPYPTLPTPYPSYPPLKALIYFKLQSYLICCGQ